MRRVIGALAKSGNPGTTISVATPAAAAVTVAVVASSLMSRVEKLEAKLAVA